MLHYLFTNDMRRKKWPDILVESANLIKNDQVPSATTDKSKNNYINTQQAYLGFYKGSKINEVCSNGDVNAVILNFVNRFQYPNTRTQDSYENAVNDGMCVAPLRLAVQLLFVLNLIDKKEAHISYDELVKYIVCDLNVAKGIKDILSVANQIVLDRKGGIKPLSMPSTEEFAKLGVEWKECPRQIKELFGLLEYVPFITLNEDEFSLVMPPAINPVEAKIFFYIVNNKEMWKIPAGRDWEGVKESYKQYFESGINQFLGLRSENSEDNKSEQPPNVDRLSIALKLFAEKRSNDTPGGVWDSYDAWTKSVRSEFVSVDESLLSNSAFNYLEYIRKYTVSGFVANTSFARHSSDEKCEVLKFLKSQKDSPKSASWYIDVANRLVVGGKQVDGMTPKSLLYFMSELHPEEFAAWTEPTYEQLEFLGLHKGVAPSDLTIETYEDCKAKQQLIVAKMKELKIGKASDDPSAPDYRTANEFLWWLGQDDNKDLIKENVMNKAMKKDKPTKYVSEKELVFNPDFKDDELLLRLLASLRAKPFAILAGHSGTGKSRYVKKLAYMTCNAEELRNKNQLPGNYLLLQVKPNWHDSTDLLGFRNAMVGGVYQKTELIKFLFKAYHFSETPFFLCLDEMNLAPVEQYFAEFLSAMESKEPVPLNDISEKDDNLLELGCEWADSLEYLKNNGFSIPNNLFIVGTVNMDETTNQFSRKVLDRAFTIEMTDVDFTNYGNVTEPSYGDTLKPAIIESLLNGEKAVSALDEEDKKADSSLVKVQKALASTPFAIAYRFANEYTLLKRAIECFDADGNMKLDALDQAVLMKILPRIAGERDYIEKVYGEKENEGLRGALEGKQVSLSKISEILKRAKDTNSLHITFWP